MMSAILLDRLMLRLFRDFLPSVYATGFLIIFLVSILFYSRAVTRLQLAQPSSRTYIPNDRYFSGIWLRLCNGGKETRRKVVAVTRLKVVSFPRKVSPTFPPSFVF